MDQATIVDLIVSILNPAYIIIAAALAWALRKIGPSIYVVVPFIMVVLNIIVDSITGIGQFTAVYIGQVIGSAVVSLIVTILVLYILKKIQGDISNK